MAVSRLDEDEANKVYFTNSLGRRQQTAMGNETGLYSLILTSNKMAKVFKCRVTHEAIPSIRKTYRFLKYLVKIFALLRICRKKSRGTSLKWSPYDRFISSENYQKVGEVAKILGYDRNSFFKKLREMGVSHGLQSSLSKIHRSRLYFRGWENQRYCWFSCLAKRQDS
jgi:anti-repressor protein